MYYNSLLLILFNLCFLPIVAQEYCDDPIPKGYNWNNTTLKATYCGETDDTNSPEGFGRMTYKTIEFGVDFEEGQWKDGQLNGEGMLFDRDGRIYTGNFNDGQILRGTETWKKNGSIYRGGFKNYNYHGPNGFLKTISDNVVITREGLFKGGLLVEGVSSIETDSRIITKKGTFFNKELENGEELINEKYSGIIIRKTYTDGTALVTYRNDQNSFNPSDILGSDTSFDVSLNRKGSINEARLAYEISLEIDGVSGDFLLDTGAMGFSIGKKMFERLKDQGIEFIDLKKEKTSVGVGGESQGKLILLNNVKIGSYTLKNVVATVSLDHNFSLLGTGLLLKFSNVIWDMKREVLTLYK